MARISGVNLPANKRIEIALTYVYGLGLKKAQNILVATKIDKNTRAKDLTDTQVKDILGYIQTNHIAVEGDLRREVLSNIKRLKEINSYRGSRHFKHLPARGQKTKTNTRTVRGNVRRTVGSGRKASAQKT